VSRIKLVLSGLQDMGEGDELNLVVQVPVLVTGNHRTVCIDIMPNEEEEQKQEQGITLVAGGGLVRHGIPLLAGVGLGKHGIQKSDVCNLIGCEFR
jgi:hypothetical protein